VSHQTLVEFASRLAISDSIHEFYRLIDTGSASKTADFFLSDANLTFGPGSPQPGTIHGPAIRDAMKAREKLTSAFTRHSVSNIRFSPGAQKAVHCAYLLVLFRSDDESRSSVPAFVADVEEIWQESGSDWRIQSRLVTPAFIRK